MHSQATTYVLDGLRPRKVRIDVYANSGGSAFTIYGLQPGDALALQALVRKAIASSGFSFPEDRHVSVRVSAADGRPSGREGMGMPIALAVLTAYGQVARDTMSALAAAGNLLEDGTIGAVRGALQMAEAVAEDPSLSCFALASASAPEAACASGVEVLQLYSLAAARYISGADRDRLRPEPQALPSTPGPDGPDFRDIRGQGPARRAAEIAAAGDHSLLLAAPRGAGQAALARRFPSILPPLRRSEALDVLRIASSMGTGSVATGRPFRSVPPTTSIAPMLGCGSPLSPGEVTSAHNGVLFLDQLEEFDIETLRAIAASRSAGRTFVGSPPTALPSSFSLVASAQCCPCGRLGIGEGSCSCEGRALARHLDRLDGVAALMDLVCTYAPPSEEELGGGPGEPSCAIRSRVIEARAKQAARLGEGRTNRQMTTTETQECGLSAEVVEALNRAMPYPVQAGRRIRVAQVSRTIADLAGAERVDSFHLAEAIELQLQPVGGDPANRPMDPENSPGIDPTS
jgi:magnesium chelatase family protein